jgi:hypothetical protein
MANHISAELPLLLSGEASRQAVDEAATHLRSCEDCRQDLVSVVVAHAALASAHRYAADVMGPARPVAPVKAAAEPRPLPDLSGVLAVIRDEADTKDTSAERRRLVPYAVAAAAAGILIGAGGVAVTQHLTESGSSGRTVQLSAFGAGSTSASANLANAEDHATVKVDAASLPSLAPTQRYEIWLTNAQRTRMQPVGWIGTDGRATVNVPQQVMNQFTNIEVSIQRVDAPTYDYSGTSVLRGQYAS